MASREGQGMQIAVILFALVTVVLAITTYIFYAESNKLRDQLKAAQETASANDKGQKVAMYKLTALMYTMGLKTSSDVEAAKGQAGGAEDPDVTKWIAQFKGDVALVGDDPANPKENYISMFNSLLTTINKKNLSVAEITKAIETMQKQKDEEITNLKAANKKLEGDLQAAITAYNAEKTKLADQNAQQAKQMNDQKAQADEQKKIADASIADLNNQVAALNKDKGTLQNSISSAQTELEKLRADQGVNFDNPDGLIIWVSQRQRLTWINLGSSDGLMRQMTFSVFSKEQASAFKMEERNKGEGNTIERVATLDSKGRIEVVRILGEHQAECRILEDKASDPILPGDWIQTPAWSPGQHFGFALGGEMDVDGDGLDDIELIKNLIRTNGGTIDAELKSDGSIDGTITVQTRYFVEGKLPTDSVDADAKKVLDGLVSMENQRKLHGAEKLSVGELLERMGWKPEEKTVGLSGRSDVGSGQFRKRSPGAKTDTKLPAEAAPAPATPSSPAAPPADPFGTK